ncbi:UNVERIFIED_CONTAM: hypothetical protein Slati_1263800 [Sesamum latifolium]|uniref:Uncharacterized protein n=1 Tax=Sesamum latifolium TaxID=2727402 RepID=A0AAW2XFQ6_9LAMI
MASVLRVPALQDLKLTLQEPILVSPAKETEKRCIFLSNIDQILNYNIPTAHFFKANPDFHPEIVAKRLKLALERVLVPYDFMAGRFKLNQESGRLEIECNSAGAGFVVASSEYSLDDLGDFVYPNLGFRQLAPQTLPNLGPEVDQPLCVFQDKAKDNTTTTTTKITSFNVVSALIWRCKALWKDGEYNNNKDRGSTLLNVVDLKSRLNPALPDSYCGNAVLVAYSSARCEDVEKWDFSKLVEKVWEGQKRVSDEYIRSMIDWLEIYNGVPHGEYMVRLRFDEVVYPWGKGVQSGPVVSHRKDICWILSSPCLGISAPKGDGNIRRLFP